MVFTLMPCLINHNQTAVWLLCLFCVLNQKADGNRMKLDQDTLEWRWSVEPNPAAINYW